MKIVLWLQLIMAVMLLISWIKLRVKPAPFAPASLKPGVVISPEAS